MDYKELVRSSKGLRVEQVWEGFEIVLGWESRNKYRIFNQDKEEIGFAAEQSNGFIGTLTRQILGHLRSFKVIVFNMQRQPVLELNFPFRWFFKELQVKTPHGQSLGSLHQKFSLLYKKFEMKDSYGKIAGTIKSPLWKMWTFELQQGPRKLGSVRKKWSGALGELFTDKDNFEVNFDDPALTPEERALLLATCLMVDIVYFENNHKRN